MRVKMHELTAADACAAKRGFGIALEQDATAYMEKAGVIKHAISDCMDGKMKKEEMEGFLTGLLSTAGYVSEKQRKLHIQDACRQIARYVGSEKRILRHAWPKDVYLGQNLTVYATPDYIWESDDMIEVIKIRCSKPTVTQKSAMEDLGLYALFCYGKELLLPGESRMIRASYYFLRKENDSSGTEKPNFDEDFFQTSGGRNIVSIEEEGSAGLGILSQMDLRFAGAVSRYVHSIPKEECSKEDCEKCDLRELCRFSAAPLALKKDPVKRSMRGLNLTAAQEKVVEYEKGICRVNAGAGAGKTMVVALRTAALINKGVKPEQMLLITFTNAGAEEMRNRIGDILADFGIHADVKRMYILTFNAFGDMILQKEYRRLGFLEPPKVIDDIERSRIIADLLNEAEIDGLDYRNFDCTMKTCMGALAVAKMVFSIVKSGQYSVSDEEEVRKKMGNKARFALESAVRSLITLYDRYDERLRAENLIEFADQEVLLLELLHKDPFYLERFGFRHITVDEFQDSSRGQIELIKRLIEAPKFESLMVVGDDAQSIFSFRDTTPEYILHFEDIIGKEVDDILLMENHRSTPEILDAANRMNRTRKERIDKDLSATRGSGRPVTVKGFLTRNEEKQYVVDTVKERLAEGAKPEEIAIIAATKYELMDMADTLGKEQIPTVLLNPEPLMENSRVTAAIALCTTINAEQDTKDMLVYANAKNQNHDLLTAEKSVLEEAIEEIQAEIEEFHHMEKEEEKKQKLMEMLWAIDENEDEVYESFLKTLESKPTTGKIFSYCSDFCHFGSTAAFRRTHNYPGVVLTTAHSSKGLEWKVVINMVSKYDGPELYTSSHEAEEMKEERKRLLFVSMTRARDELIITGQFVSHGKRGNYTYNQFLENAYECIGDSFSPEEVEKIRKDREKEKKSGKKTAKKIAETKNEVQSSIPGPDLKAS